MKKKLIPIILSSIFLVSCANTDIYRGDVYTPDQVKKEQKVRYGRIVSAHPVKIQGQRTGVGTLLGSTLGGFGGSNVGKGSGQTLGSIIGALLGSMAGSTMEEKATQISSSELTIELDNGETIVVVQKIQPGFVKGARVRIVGNNNNINVNLID